MRENIDYIRFIYIKDEINQPDIQMISGKSWKIEANS